MFVLVGQVSVSVYFVIEVHVSVASPELVSPGAATDGGAPFF